MNFREFCWLNPKSICLALVVAVGIPAVQCEAQQNETDSQESAAAESEPSDKDKDQVDERFVVPEDADVIELKKFIKRTQKIMSSVYSREEYLKTYPKVHQTILDASTVGLEQAETDDEVSSFLSYKLDAFDSLGRLDDSKAGEATAFAEKWSSDPRADIASIADGFLITQKIPTLVQTQDSVAQLIKLTENYINKYGPNDQTLRVARRVGTSLNYSDFKTLAATAYEKFGALFAEADDEELSNQGQRFVASARRLNLIGNPMKVFGTQANGEEFDWESYRGKVVLVDFWASWCGPCIGELPNMKKNLEAYGDRGFTIVGINMDSTMDAMTKCVEEEEISWTNIFPQDKNTRGWKAPMATYYGVSGIPTAILVNKEGKVVSLRARGTSLDEALEKLLGPAEGENPGPTDESESSDAGLR